MPNGNLQLLNGFSPRRLAPIGVGVAWVALLQGVGFVMQSTGHAPDAILWRWISIAVGAAASLISRSHVLKLAGRLVVLRLLVSGGFTGKAKYLEMRNATEAAFENDINPKI